MLALRERVDMSCWVQGLVRIVFFLFFFLISTIIAFKLANGCAHASSLQKKKMLRVRAVIKQNNEIKALQTFGLQDKSLRSNASTRHMWYV